MADQYFIKRGETVKGPFSLAKLQAFHEARQLKANDMLSNGAEGHGCVANSMQTMCSRDGLCGLHGI